MLLKSLKLNLLANNLIKQTKREITVRKWRRLMGRPEFTSNSGPLVELPDWSYTDGRGYGPLTVGQKTRYLRDQEMAKTVVHYMKYMKSAKELVPENK